MKSLFVETLVGIVGGFALFYATNGWIPIGPKCLVETENTPRVFKEDEREAKEQWEREKKIRWFTKQPGNKALIDKYGLEEAIRIRYNEMKNKKGL